MRKIDVARVDALRPAIVYLQGAELTVAAQALIEQRLLFFYQPRLQQQRAHFSRRLEPGNASRLAQHGGLVRRTEMG